MTDIKADLGRFEKQACGHKASAGPRTESYS